MSSVHFAGYLLNKTVADTHKTCFTLNRIITDSVGPCRCEYQHVSASSTFIYALQVLHPTRKQTWSRGNLVRVIGKPLCPRSCCLPCTRCFINHASNACCLQLWETLDVISSSTCTNRMLLRCSCISDTHIWQAWKPTCALMNVRTCADSQNKTRDTIHTCNAYSFFA